MVDCGNARCAQERRLFRKELMTWSKKLPLVVGLETIGERLAGDLAEDLFQPWKALESEDTVDWEPEQSCFYCDKKLKFLFESVNELEEDDVGNTTQEGLGLGYLNELLPYCPQYYTSSSNTLDGSQPLDLSAGASRSPSRSTDGDMVSAGNRAHVELKIPQIRSQSKFRKDGFLNGKRSYTEEELVAAVGDIRSGKLGTRRAAALYGIPRSTLRNKIFKLESEVTGGTDEEESLDEPAVVPTQLPLPPVLDHNAKMTLSELMQTSPFLLMPPMPFPIPVQHLEAHTNNNHHLQDIWDWRLEQIRRKHNLNGLKEHDEFRSMCGLDTEVSAPGEEAGGRASAPSSSSAELKLTILPELVRRLTEHRVDMERCTGLPQQSSYDKATSPESSPVTASPHLSAATLRIPSFKPSLVPAEEPPPQSKDGKAYDCGKIGDTLKNIIAKTIAEKVRTRTHCGGPNSEKASTPCSSPAAVPSTQTPPSSAFSIPSASPAKKSRKQPSPQSRKNNAEQSNTASSNSGKENTTTSTQNGASGTAPVKKTRPKRGQYRKYNSQLLMEAVKAVQRGEMSVHRAGSYFGVPHSTLEYKVKERHLLRQKKIKENQSAKSSPGASNSASKSSTDSPTQAAVTVPPAPASSHTSQPATASSNGTSPVKTEPSNGLLKFDPSRSLASWLQHGPPNGLTYTPAGLPPSPFTANFAISTPASELLKKLQQKVQNKSHSFCPEESFLPNGFPRANGGALQDGFLFIK